MKSVTPRNLTAKGAEISGRYLGFSLVCIFASFSLFNAIALVPLALLGIVGFYIWVMGKRTNHPRLGDLVILGIGMLALAGYTFARSALSQGIVPTWTQFDRHIPLIIVGFIALGLSHQAVATAGQSGRKPLGWLGSTVSIFMILATAYYSVFEFSLYGRQNVIILGQQLPLPFVNKLLAAQIWCLAGTCCLLGWHSRQAWWDRALGILGYLCALYAVSVLATSRGPTLILLAQLPIILLYLGLKPGFNTKQFAVTLAWSGIISGGIGVACYLVLLTTNAQILDRLVSALAMAIHPNQSEQSLSERGQMLVAAIQAIQQSPIWGHGLAQRFEMVGIYLVDGFPNYSHLHNFVLNLLVDGGLISLALFLMLPFMVWRMALAASGLDALFAAYSVTMPALLLGLSNSIFHTAETGSHFLLGLILVAWSIKQSAIIFSEQKG